MPGKNVQRHPSICSSPPLHRINTAAGESPHAAQRWAEAHTYPLKTTAGMFIDKTPSLCGAGDPTLPHTGWQDSCRVLDSGEKPSQHVHLSGPRHQDRRLHRCCPCPIPCGLMGPAIQGQHNSRNEEKWKGVFRSLISLQPLKGLILPLPSHCRWYPIKDVLRLLLQSTVFLWKGTVSMVTQQRRSSTELLCVRIWRWIAHLVG